MWSNIQEEVEDDDEEEWDKLLSQINYQSAIPQVCPPSDKNVYSYENVNVTFPYSAYQSQKDMMERIIHAANRGYNCLLESPTGTGKTAALLCSLLAWQEHCQQNHDFLSEAYAKALENTGPCTCGLVLGPESPFINRVTIMKSRFREKFKIKIQTEVKDATSPSKNVNGETTVEESSPKKPKTSCSSSTLESVVTKDAQDLCMHCIKVQFKRSGPPRIYYASRTHTQITQVVKQLKQTAYSHVMMTILSSRQQSCINEDLKMASRLPKPKQDNVNGQKLIRIVQNARQNPKLPLPEEQVNPRDCLDDKCRALRKNYFRNCKDDENFEAKATSRMGEKIDFKEAKCKEYCTYFCSDRMLAQQFGGFAQKGAWEIEDLVEYGRECNSCPYYASKALHPTANIVFCPYNYLISPGISSNTNVVLENSIIVFDEAHNIEDLCQKTTSLCIDHNRLDLRIRLIFDDTLKDIINMIPRKDKAIRALEYFSKVLRQLSSLILAHGRELSKIEKRDPPPHKSFVGKEQIVTVFSSVDLGPNGLSMFADYLSDLDDDSEFENRSKIEEDDGVKLPSECIRYIKDLYYILKLMFGEDMKRIEDYKIVLAISPSASTSTSTSTSTAPQKLPDKYILDIICLNPAIGFEPIKKSAHSIIVASGTLTPLISFSSELDTEFKCTLSAKHVVNRSQVWAGVVRCGPTSLLEMQKKYQDQPETQDEIGTIILSVCKIIPHGVIVFLPSYTLMNKLKERWSGFPKNNPILSQIRRLKFVYFEENKDKDVFMKDMHDYKENIKTPKSSLTGCVLFAVFRGKVSEGIDFADNQARAVITVGIPYSNLLSYEVKGKMDYNNSKLKSPKKSDRINKLLSGYEWYTVQAFRAMNQGFGRCIRHINDWGALILLDSRLSLPKYRPYLSGWVQEHLTTHEDFELVKSSLSTFIERRTQADPPPDWDNDDEMFTQVCDEITRQEALKASSNSESTPALSNLDESINDFSMEIHDATTQRIRVLESTFDHSSSDLEVSYHSGSDTNGLDSSPNMLLGTP